MEDYYCINKKHQLEKMTYEQITSTQNPKIKKLLQLQQKSSERRKAGLFVVEGQREVERCAMKGYEIDSIFFCRNIAKSAQPELNDTTEHLLERLQREGKVRIFEISKEVYSKIAYRESTEGVVAEVRTKDMKLTDLGIDESGMKNGHAPLLVVLEGVEKPGNLGAILRTADASGADAVIVCDPRTDLYNPNLIRSSTGGIFSVPCVACTSEECIDFLKAKGIRILTAQLQDSSLYYDTDMRCGTAIVMGTEATGLTDIWRKAADAHIRIPMLGILDSLNVSVSAAVLLFEAVRQRDQF